MSHFVRRLNGLLYGGDMEKLTIIKCADCGEEEEFMDDGITLDCMPDGCLVENGEWVCQGCCYKRGLLEES